LQEIGHGLSSIKQFSSDSNFFFESFWKHENGRETALKGASIIKYRVEFTSRQLQLDENITNVGSSSVSVSHPSPKYVFFSFKVCHHYLTNFSEHYLLNGETLVCWKKSKNLPTLSFENFRKGSFLRTFSREGFQSDEVPDRTQSALLLKLRSNIWYISVIIITWTRLKSLPPKHGLAQGEWRLKGTRISI